MEATSIAAMLIILGLWYWMSERAKGKTEQEDNHKARNDFMSLVDELGVDGISDELVYWLETKILLQTGKAGLQDYTNELRGLVEENGKKAAIVQLMFLQQHYANEKHKTDSNKKWLDYVDAFRKYNHAQQKHEIERLKKISDPHSEDDTSKINALEMIHLGNVGVTDVMVGDLKLFSMRRR